MSNTWTYIISNLSLVTGEEQPHKFFKLDRFLGYIYRYTPVTTPLDSWLENRWLLLMSVMIDECVSHVCIAYLMISSDLLLRYVLVFSLGFIPVCSDWILSVKRRWNLLHNFVILMGRAWSRCVYAEHLLLTVRYSVLSICYSLCCRLVESTKGSVDE